MSLALNDDNRQVQSTETPKGHGPPAFPTFPLSAGEPSRPACLLRTDFSGLFGGPPPPAPAPRVRQRCRNNSQTQRPGMPCLRNPRSAAVNLELQFPVEGLEAFGSVGDRKSCERKRNEMKESTQTAYGFSSWNETGYFSQQAATKTSFDCVLSDDSAEAYDFFAAASASGVTFDGSNLRQPVPKRQRHFSLEDYNENMDDASDNSNSSFATASLAGQEADVFPNCRSFVAGSDTMSTPSTPSTAGLDLPNAFTFPPVPMPEMQPLTGPPIVLLDTNSEHISSQLLGELKERLLNAVLSKMTLDFPSNLLHEISAHVIQEASLEPCGLKGCLIFIYFEGENDRQYVNTLRCDPATIPTFELALTLRQSHQFKKGSWISSLVKRISVPTVSTSYKLVKRRKYRLYEVEELSLHN